MCDGLSRKKQNIAIWDGWKTGDLMGDIVHGH
jgi:hypothetical protein